MFTILHLDDEDAVRYRVREILADMGHEVHSASSIPEAELLLRNKKFDVIIADSDLPNRLEGIHFILEIKENLPEQNVVILADKLQLRKLPYVSKGFLSDKKMFLLYFNRALGIE